MQVSRRLFSVIFIAVIFLSCGGFSVASIAVAASPDVIDYDYTRVLDDLASSTANGNEFNVTDYPADLNGTVQLITFVEYAYSADAARRGHYGLYVYLYNPAGIDFPATSPGHKIQIATKYNEHGFPSDYEKFDLKILSVSPAPYRARFIKAKVIDRAAADGRNIAARVNSAARRYDISGVELIAKNQDTAQEYGIGRTYIYTGFAEGYGDAPGQSTLSCQVLELETISLQVNHTFFRTGISAAGVDHQNQLDSVYFSVDERILEEYGRLQRVKAEWYEYKTKPIVVTQNEDVYNYLLPDLGQIPDAYYYALFYDKMQASFPPGAYTWKWAYTGSSANPTKTDKSLYYLFYTPDIQQYDPRGAEAVVGGVTSNQLYQYIMQYDKSYTSGLLPIKHGTISADLFAATVDAARLPLFNALEQGRKRGHFVQDFDADVDLLQMPSYGSTNPSFSQKARDFGFWETILNQIPDLDDDYENISPIYQVSLNDFVGSTDEISTRLLIRREDVLKFKSYYLAEKAAGREVFLFRYAATDYLSAMLEIEYWSFGFPHTINNQAYVAQETVFLDFDIIQLTFNREGVYTVIPVVNNPIDAVADLTPPAYIPQPPLVVIGNALKTLTNKLFGGIADLFGPQMPDWLRTVIMVVLGVLFLAAVILLAPVWVPILKGIIKGLFWLISLPFRAARVVIKKARERRAASKAKVKAEKTAHNAARIKPQKSKALKAKRAKPSRR